MVNDGTKQGVEYAMESFSWEKGSNEEPHWLSDSALACYPSGEWYSLVGSYCSMDNVT